MPNYQVQKAISVLSATALTADYNASTTARVTIPKMESCVFYLDYIQGTAESANVLTIKIEYSPDGINFYREVTESISTGTRTLSIAEYEFTATQTAGTADKIRIPIETGDPYIRISFKEGFSANAGTIAVSAVIGGR